ncbi:Lrp/AsnC ligand binding domain-containing protein [Kordiimonas aquimaris]|uniref:Lrp/AsnC ligand binding domain-containing protein n=1 Tax=Kordiimonas aquimaris TaxID=707591 RepID=UPI0021D284EF|nr:Lrp/AsnC ligand binding domain-containing protein [Kordiimonas aquimaris]
MKALDRFDHKILKLLQRDGRMSTLDLADKISLSPTATTERVKRLRRDGYIVGYQAVLSPRLLDKNLLSFVEVRLESTGADIFERFSEAVQKIDEIMECHMVAGGFDYLLKIRCADMAAYRFLLSDKINQLPGVRETNTYAVMEEVKNSNLLPLG